jgi:4-amino-4-deoxy-L-arabinose transferase-like glycosyltransferase
MAGLAAVLVAGVVPLYALGAVVMTIDPLSAFFWVWAANFFSRALRENQFRDWIMTGFAVGSGFLGKYLNALELVAFACFLILVPGRRVLLRQVGFWLMLAVTLVCISPVLWWNQRHHWISAGQLGDRGHVHEAFGFHADTVVNFLEMQAGVVSPLLFLLLLVVAVASMVRLARTRLEAQNEGELLLLILFLSVFVFYLVVALHIRCEANWPAVSYLSLIALLAGRWTEGRLFVGMQRVTLSVVFVLGWLQTLLFHDTAALHLPVKMDPMSRVAGWSGIAEEMGRLRQEQRADLLLADGYKEASVVAFALPDKPFIYVLRHHPPSNQFDFWPRLPTAPPHRILWLTAKDSAEALGRTFRSITPLESIQVWYRGKLLRSYRVYLCQNSGDP